MVRKHPIHTRGTRLCALALCGALTVSALAGGAAAEGAVPAPACDEAYYATLDYYGALEEGSVVKSYDTRGAGTLLDYGVYDQVVNLTDGAAPLCDADTLQFDVSGSPDGRFYFEGKTAEPFARLPWTLTVGYRLNGVDVPAEQLAGKTGVVELRIDAVPNRGASAYAQNNFVLEAAALFNADDIVSLEAPGAQIQLVGNLRAVLFLALPGQEAHFTIRVGAEDFSFDGLTFMMEPATLMQLDEISVLRDAKDDIEGAYDDIDASLEAVLDALDGMSGSLNATADGLDRLNDARAQISAGKDGVYQSADGALADLSTVSGAMAPLGGYLDAASAALAETKGTLNGLTETITALGPQLESTRKLIADTQKDVNALKGLLDTVEDYGDDVRREVDNLRVDLSRLTDAVGELRNDANTLQNVLSRLPAMQISPISQVTAQGKSPAEIEAAVRAAAGYAADFQSERYGCGALSEYIELRLLAQGMAAAAGADESAVLAQLQAAAQQAGISCLAAAEGAVGDAQQIAAAQAGAAAYAELLAAYNDGDLQSQLAQLETVNGIIGAPDAPAGNGTVNGAIRQVNASVAALAGQLQSPLSELASDLDRLCGELAGKNGLGDDTDDILLTLAQVLDDLEDHEGEAGALLADMNAAGTILSTVTERADDAIALLESLNGTFNAYEPTLQSALTDGAALADAAASGIANAKTFLQSVETLAKSSGRTLDAGTEQTLSGLAAALRQSTVGLTETDAIRDAKEIITGRIEEEWNAYTGEDNNLLLIDPDAPMVSLTSDKNPAPASVQVLMRTREIKPEEPAAAAVAAREEAPSGGFWSRLGQMFRDLWHALTFWRHA